MRFWHSAPLLALAALFHASAAAAQIQHAHSFSVVAPTPAVQSGQRFWVGLGVGASTAGLTGQVDGSLLLGPQLFRARYTAHNPVGTVGSGLPMSELAVMYGRGTWLRNGNWVSAAAGLGLAAGTDIKDPANDFRTVGLSAEVQMITRRRPTLSLTGIANLNAEQSMAGVTVGLIIGKAP